MGPGSHSLRLTALLLVSSALAGCTEFRPATTPNLGALIKQRVSGGDTPAVLPPGQGFSTCLRLVGSPPSDRPPPTPESTDSYLICAMDTTTDERVAFQAVRPAQVENWALLFPGVGASRCPDGVNAPQGLLVVFSDGGYHKADLSECRHQR